MADKTDELLTNYYSGLIDTKILLRRAELQWRPNDDNAGIKSLNKHTRPLEDMLARYEADSILHELTKQRDAIKRLETTFSEETKQIVQMHYDRRERLSWVIISLRMNLSERTCRTYQKTFKDSVAQTFNELDIAV
ncbi:MAG: RinA family protein [Leuconostoc mesenteroides]|jgi:RinA family phage transcriptional activator|nr:RinA family protein [Leuconostoc mesenteroides]MCI2152843.1 RinA family protein [Leuconostoc mesenteroides]MCI2168054.1 RinA family protein [Leuconostoc mesenteroides]